MRFPLNPLFVAALVLSAAWARAQVVVQTNAPEEKEFAALSSEDEAAQKQVEMWQAENAKSDDALRADLDRRIQERLKQVDGAYTDFLRRYPNHVRARLAYGCFLNDRHDEAAAQVQWEKALELDPHNADAYNNLAGRYTEIGPAKKAFDYFTKAIELKSSEPSYYHNFADALYVLRAHAMTNYGCSEQQVYSRSLLLYSNAARLDPTNSSFAWDFAQTYYALKPLPYQQALQAWTNALASAATPVDRERIVLHLARVKMLAGQLAEARAELNSVTNLSTAQSKATLLRAIEERQQEVRPEAELKK